MLPLGTGVGTISSTIIFSITLFGLQILVCRDVDFLSNGLATNVAIFSEPIGTFIVLPFFGHATCLYMMFDKSGSLFAYKRPG